MTNSSAPTGTDPFHAGEHAIQQRAGVEQSIAGYARSAIRPFMPEQHRQFFIALPFLIASARDAQGCVWATILTGKSATTGFIESPDERSLQISGAPIPGDALEHAFVPGASIGLLGIALESRRRNRLNGTLGSSIDGALQVQVDQSFGNCPQYISQRQWHPVQRQASDTRVNHRHDLDAEARQWISSSDTCFIASGFSQSDSRIATEGMDVSHRGGPAGFVTVIDSSHLSLPDYAGNDFFNTLGNLALDPRIGLLFLDFDTGSLLQITGRASIVWHDTISQPHQTSRRSIKIDITEIITHHAALPIQWSAPAGAVRELRLQRRIRESETVTSFEFAPRDSDPVLPFQAGQHLPISIPLSAGQNIERSYSLSGSPRAGTYRISVKREPQGQISNWLHDSLHEGDPLLAHPPTGDFVLQHNDRPIVLLAAGIGITPLLSMLYERMDDPKPVSLFYSARNAAQYPFAEELHALKQQGANVMTLFTQPGQDDTPGNNFDRIGRINIDTIKMYNPDLDAEFYLCGPLTFLGALQDQLLEAGVDIDRLHTEQF